MTTADHPSLDTIADYCALLLPMAEADAISAHLSLCTRCAANAAAVGQVPAILSGAARTPMPMPESVQRALDDAIRAESEARAGSVIRLAGRRTPQAPSGLSRAGRPLLAAAAAVVAVAGIAGIIRSVDSSADGNSQTSSAAHYGQPTAAGAAAASGSASQQEDHQASPPVLSPQNLPAYADRLTSGNRTGSLAPRLSRSTGCAAPDTIASDVVTTARWHGARAVIVVDAVKRRVAVLDCRTASTLLYSSSY